MYRYYSLEVYDTFSNELLYESALLNTKSMFKLVKNFSNDYSDNDITIKITTHNYLEPKWWLEEE